MTANVRWSIEEGVGLIVISRPKALNALDAQTLNELEEAIDALEADPSAGVIVLTGEGEKAFVAGADISTMPSMSPEQARAFSERGSLLFARLEALPKVVIGAINGFALGGGCELALACDFLIASERAIFGQPEVKLGIIAGFGGTQRLARKVPVNVAMDLLVSGRTITAEEALRWGLVSRVVPADQLMATARAAAQEVLSRGPRAVAATKALVQQAHDQDLASGLRAETDAFGEVFKTEDAREGVSAFLAKRAPSFQGR